MKQKTGFWIAFTSLLTLLCLIPLSFGCLTLICQGPYSDTYYAELSRMVTRLHSCQKKKIVVIGNSSVAFGVNSALMEEELEAVHLDYDVVNFGLYGSIGTKAMLELSLDDIQKDDIVLFAPEENEQAMSTYFSGSEFFKAADCDYSLLNRLSTDCGENLFSGYFTYLADIVKRKEKEPVTPKGVYALSSFNDRCDLIYERKENIMADHYDSNNPILLDDSLLSDSFVSMVNDYATKVKEKGANIYYSYAPMNALSLSQSQADMAAFHEKLQGLLSFSIISSPLNAIYEPEWFYDSNFHLNDAGEIKNTLRFVSEIKTQYQISTPNHTEIPDKPMFPIEEESQDYDNSQVDDFLYQKKENGYQIVGIKEEAKGKEEYLLPGQYQGERIVSFAANVFYDCPNLKSLTLQSNIATLYDHSFVFCPKLERMVLLHQKASQISVGYRLLEENSSIKIQVSQEAYSSFANDYFWGHYLAHLTTA